MSNQELDFTIRRDRLYQQVSDRIQQLIIDESLLPGDRLPSERELAERLAVSRTVIREAIRTLGVRGLVAVKPGRGTFIQEVSSKNAVDSIGLLLKTRRVGDDFRDLSEIRFALEVDMAGLAARRATEEEIEAMAECLRLMETHAEDPERFIHYDLEFHSTIARATHNQLYLVLLEPITDLLVDFRMTAYRYDMKRAVEGGLTHHRNILAKIRERDSEGARRAMRDHLKQGVNLIAEAQSDGIETDKSAGSDNEWRKQ